MRTFALMLAHEDRTSVTQIRPRAAALASRTCTPRRPYTAERGRTSAPAPCCRENLASAATIEADAHCSQRHFQSLQDTRVIRQREYRLAKHARKLTTTRPLVLRQSAEVT